jgi:hypothetical protein
MGRRALKKLEKEIQDLREELERTQAKGDELEEKARAGFGISAEKLMDEMWKKKEEREDRLKALKRKSEDLGDGNLEVRNFAPTGALWTATSPSHFPVAKYLDSHKPPTSPPPDINLATKPVSPPVAESCDIGSSSSSVASLPQREYAVVSQLLFKIRELEETNSQIRAQQAATAAKLQAVHRDTRRISKLYECLGDQAGVEWESEDGQTNHSVAHDVIRFQSLKKSLEKDLSDPTADDDVFGVTNNHSTVRGVAALNFNTVKRSRKTVVGLFDTPASESAQQDLENVDTMPSLPLSLLPPADPDTSRMSWLMGITSPALSELSLGTHTLAETSTSGRPGRTLGSELGSEFGDDWALNGENHHLRKTSLYDLSLLSTTQSPSPMPIDLLVTPNAGGLQTPESMTHPIRLEVETPTPKPSKGGGQTNRPRIDGRTNTPVERAVCERLVDASIHTSRPPTPMGLSGASDEITGTSTGGEPGKCSIVRSQSSNEVKETGCLRATVRTKKEGLVAMMLELWLWLQFIIIILVFLWAMAKRGPKSILDGSEHRRARLRQ